MDQQLDIYPGPGLPRASYENEAKHTVLEMDVWCSYVGAHRPTERY